MTESASGAASASELDHAYFRALEEAFIRLRGAPLLLSPADWQVARSWRRQGVPLELAVRVMERIFDRQKDAEHKSGIRGLRYFRTAVERSWRRIVELGGDRPAAADTEPIDVGARLERLAAALPARADLAQRAAADPGGPGAALASALAGVADQLAGLSGDAESVERELARIDRTILARLRAGLGAEARSAVEGQVRAALDRLSDRGPAEGRERTLELLVDRYLRESLSLPLLSLFSPEARAAPADD